MSVISRQPAGTVVTGRGPARAVLHVPAPCFSPNRPGRHRPSPVTHHTPVNHHTSVTHDLTHLITATIPSPSQLLITRPFSLLPEQTPLHRGCARGASPVEAVL
jgi:hypothetical protein